MTMRTKEQYTNHKCQQARIAYQEACKQYEATHAEVKRFNRKHRINMAIFMRSQLTEAKLLRNEYTGRRSTMEQRKLQMIKACAAIVTQPGAQ